MWSIHVQDLCINLEYFKVLQGGIETIRSKLVLKLFDEYANILKGMYSTRFNGCPTDGNVSSHTDPDPNGPISPSSSPSKPDILITLGVPRKRKRGIERNYR